MLLPNISDQTLEQAADWADRFPELNAEGRSELEQWLAASADHCVAFDEMCSLLGSSELNAALVMASRAVDDSTAVTAADKTVVAFPSKNTSNPSLWWQGLAVAAVALMVLAIVFNQPPETQPYAVAEVVADPERFETVAAQRRQAVLQDNTSIVMNAKTQLTVAFDTQSRHVDLTRGQVYFDVSHDKQRPFTISAGSTEIKVLGTAFDVNYVDGGVVVSVYEGEVSVRNQHSLLVQAGQQVRIDNGVWSEVASFTAHDADWREGWHEAHQQPLSEVLVQLERYLEKPLQVGLTTQLQQPVSGRFKLDEAENSLALIAQLYDLTLTDTSTHLVITD